MSKCRIFMMLLFPFALCASLAGCSVQDKIKVYYYIAEQK